MQMYSKFVSQSATQPGVSFHPAIKKEFGGKRPRNEEGLDGKKPRMEEALDEKSPRIEERLETTTGPDLVEIKKEEEDSKEFVIMDQEKLQGTKIELEGNSEEKKPRYIVQCFRKRNLVLRTFTEDCMYDSFSFCFPKISVTLRYVGPKKAETPYDVPVPRGGGICRYKQELVVGNVSKWLEGEGEREGMATHKWMLYVRGGKANPDLSAVVSRVEVRLHNSLHVNVNRA